MEVVFAWFANSAEVLGNGLFYVLGGGVDIVFGESFPMTQNKISLVLRLRTFPNEFNREHELYMDIVRPDGSVMQPDTRYTFTPVPFPRHPERPNVMTFVVDHFNLVFPEPGDYIFRFSVNGVEIGRTSLEIVQTPQR
jgi:hypothetical protein